MTLLLERDDRSYVLEPGETLETDLGVLEVPEDTEPGDTVRTHLDESFAVRRLRGPDCFHHFERTGAPMTPKDVGLLVGHTGIDARDRVLDVGTGTGVLAAWLGLLGATVVTVERNPEFADVARENVNAAGVDDRVRVRTGDALELIGARDGASGDESGGITDGKFDALTLDTGDAPDLLRRASALLRDGAVVGVYVPFVEDARRAAEAGAEVGIDLTARETFQRRMDFDDRGSRPSTAGVGHTGYLLTGRFEDAPG